MLSSLQYFFKRSPRLLSLAIATGLLSGASNVALVAVINQSLYRKDGASQSLVWAFIGVGLLLIGTRFVSQVVLNNLGKQTIVDLQIGLTQRIQATPLRRLEEIGPHRLMSAITDDVSTVAQVATQLPGYCLDVAVLIGCLVYLGWLSMIVQLTVIAFLALGVGIYKLTEGKTTPMLIRIRQNEILFFKHLRALIEGSKELKLNRRRRIHHFGRSLRATAATITQQAYKIAMILSGVASWALIVFYAMIGAVLFLVPAHSHLDPKAVTGGLFVILILRGPLEGVMNAFSTMSRSSVALRNISSLGLAEAEDAAGGASIDEQQLPEWEHLQLTGVTRSYPAEEGSGQFVLGPLDLSFAPREIVFVFGGNGSGKTTLAKLLSGLYTPESGEIRFNHRVVDDASREQYRQYFSAIFSDFFLFDDLAGAPGANIDATAREYLAQLRLSHKVQVNDGVLSTTQLSQGQRKRLALLMAYVEDRPICIFDEWAADQDPEFKDIFYHKILPALRARDKTIFVISHDDRYFHVADRIIKLDYGRVESDYRQQEASSAPARQRDTRWPVLHPEEGPEWSVSQIR